MTEKICDESYAVVKVAKEVYQQTTLPFLSPRHCEPGGRETRGDALVLGRRVLAQSTF